MEIQELDRRTVELIVSGEVYVRPLSIVKECVENSLDAAAKRIQIYIENGGYTKIQIDDDGSGIPRDVLPHLCKSHYTTKNRDKRDTLGFRGEALACLCYMCNIIISTKTSTDAIGCVARFEDGEISDLQERALADDHGTSIEVTDIYKVHKVRRNNKSQAASERAAIAAFVVDLKVFYADVVFTLSDLNGIILTAQDPAMDRSYASRVPIICNNYPSLRPEFLTELSFDKIWGNVRAIICLKQGRDNLTDSKFTVFVNSRPVVWTNLKRMALKTYETYMSAANSMNLVLFWDIKIVLTDENVDRTKLSIQVMDEAIILSDIEAALKSELSTKLMEVVVKATMKEEDNPRALTASPSRLRTPRVSTLNLAALTAAPESAKDQVETYYLDSNRRGNRSKGAVGSTDGRNQPPSPQILRIDSTRDCEGVRPASSRTVPKVVVRSLTFGSTLQQKKNSPRLMIRESSDDGPAGGSSVEEDDILPVTKRQGLTHALKPLSQDNTYETMKRELQEGDYDILPSFDFVGTVDMRKFVAGCDTCMVTVNLTNALKKDVLPKLMTRTKLRPELNLLESHFLSAKNLAPSDTRLTCKTLGLEIKDSVLRAIPRLPISEPNVALWVELIYERGFECVYDADVVCDMMLEHEHRLQSHYTRFISGAKLWETWTKKNRKSAPDEIIVSPPLKIILRHFERC